jgi:hypothetical protein
VHDRDLPPTEPMVMPWLADPVDRAQAVARRRVRQAARRASLARASALTMLAVPPPLPR